MHKKIFNAMYAMNIFFQSFLSLATPSALSFLVAYLLNKKVGVGGWIYAPLVMLGVGIGFYSMIKFILTASRALEALEREQKEYEEKNKK